MCILAVAIINNDKGKEMYELLMNQAEIGVLILCIQAEYAECANVKLFESLYMYMHV